MNHRLKFGFPSPAKGLALALALQFARVQSWGQTLPAALNIVAIEGEGATGPVRQRPSHVPVIRVVDERQRPVSGAAVLFTLPTEGATGVFTNGAKTLIVMTDAEGIATAQGLSFNQIPGKVPVSVNVSYKGLTARTTITELSVASPGYKPGGGGHGKLIAFLVVVAAGGGAGGAFFAMRNNGSTAVTPTSAMPQPIGITPGTGSLAPPH